jgi:CMP/dCMP kinase
MIIAIDGPAASGKGTLAKRLAAHYGYRHLDTGVIYRAVAHVMLSAGFDLNDETKAAEVAMTLDPGTFEDPALKSQEVGSAASVVSALPKVREALVAFQRQFAADPRVRAQRRTLEARGRGEPADEAAVLADILARDERDQNRSVAPLKQAPDAYLLDNSHLDIEGGVRAAIDIVEAVRAGRQRV